MALDLGVDRIEIDVQQTKDNEIIVLHDRSLRRTTNGFGRVKHMTYNEILKYSAGVKFNSFYKSEKVPTLEQVIDLIDGKVELLIEVKYSYLYYPNIERHILNVINKTNAKGWCKIISFNDKVLRRMHRLDPEVKLGKLFIGKHAQLPISVDKTINFKPLKRYEFVDEIIVQYKYATKRIINKVHEMGKPLNVWTVNDKEIIEKLIERGVDGIITDYPNLLLKYKR